eukprot:TRINITY_DN5019_c0_g1_i1.p1 TRINITY_DN5019_c0_g1~~TRINITY_DN5019_c0_g1_i1.p1  ORF type:complete len:295 (-),score=89.15 TRINITY_DN5019_c0_g1_i1:144-1028(-)
MAVLLGKSAALAQPAFPAKGGSEERNALLSLCLKSIHSMGPNEAQRRQQQQPVSTKTATSPNASGAGGDVESMKGDAKAKANAGTPAETAAAAAARPTGVAKAGARSKKAEGSSTMTSSARRVGSEGSSHSSSSGSEEPLRIAVDGMPGGRNPAATQQPPQQRTQQPPQQVAPQQPQQQQQEQKPPEIGFSAAQHRALQQRGADILREIEGGGEEEARGFSQALIAQLLGRAQQAKMMQNKLDLEPWYVQATQPAPAAYSLMSQAQKAQAGLTLLMHPMRQPGELLRAFASGAI